MEGELSRSDWRSLRVGKVREGEWGMRWRDGEEGAEVVVAESERVLTHFGHIREMARERERDWLLRKGREIERRERRRSLL